MAIGIYAGAGGVKTVSSIYVGAGGVKTVSAVYVGAGSVKQVWPAYTVGSKLFDFSSDYWSGYRKDDKNTSRSWASATPSFGSNYMSLNIGGRFFNGAGVYFVSKETVYASGLQYIGFYADFTDSASSGNVRHTLYVSIGSSSTTAPESDSGYGNTGQYGRSTFFYFLIDLTSCTRTGYFKIQDYCVNTTTDTDDNGSCAIYYLKVGTSTNISDYFSSSSSWNATITVT